MMQHSVAVLGFISVSWACCAAQDLKPHYARLAQWQEDVTGYPGGGPRSVGDWNRDGYLDLIVPGATGVQILINSGNGQWKWYLTSSSGVVGLGRLGWGDINGDGYYDVVVAGTTYPWGAGDKFVFLGDSSGGLTLDTTGRLPARTGAFFGRDCYLIDFDRDGDLDVLTKTLVAPTRSDLQFFVNNGTGRFTEDNARLPGYGPGYIDTLAVMDVDQDGDIDVVFGGSGLPLQIWTNDGAGRFSVGQTLFSYGVTDMMTVGDINGDGWPDMLTRNVGMDRLWVNHQGTLVDETYRLPPGLFGAPVELADIDGDGRCDLVAGSIFTQTPSGTFVNTTSTFYYNGWSTCGMMDISIADFDGDGDLDFLYSTNCGSSGALMMNLIGHTRVAPTAGIGQKVPLEVFGNPGDLVIPFLSDRIAPIQLGGYGMWGLDVSRMGALTAMIVGTNGKATLDVPVPNDPTMRNKKMYFQSVRVSGIAARLTNWSPLAIQ